MEARGTSKVVCNGLEPLRTARTALRNTSSIPISNFSQTGLSEWFSLVLALLSFQRKTFRGPYFSREPARKQTVVPSSVVKIAQVPMRLLLFFRSSLASYFGMIGFIEKGRARASNARMDLYSSASSWTGLVAWEPGPSFWATPTLESIEPTMFSKYTFALS